MATIDGVDDTNVGVAAASTVGVGAMTVATSAQRRAVRRLHEVMEAFEAQLQCPICLCAYAAPASLPCNHCFCEECIHRALELKQVCPICKAPCKKRSLRHDTMIQQLQQAAELWVAVPFDIGVEDEEDEKEVKMTTPVRINRLTMTAANTSSSSSSSASSNEKPSRRRKRASTFHPHTASSEDDVPMTVASTLADQNGNHQRAEHDDALKFKRRAIAKVNGAYATAATNGHALHEQANDSSSNVAPTAFTVGDLVEVIDRTWRGINKPGGAAWITSVNGDGTYDVKYIIGTGRESHIPDQYILTPREEIGSLATPGRAVKQHRRKQNKSATPPSIDLLDGHGIASLTSKTTSTIKRSDLVFLFSGYTDDELDQLKLWADALGAQVVENWSTFVTHLIAKCASPKEVAASLAEDDYSMGNLSSSSSTNGHARKRALFREEPHKRWVKIRSMKYLKALVAGRWIVSEEWLRECVKHHTRLAEALYEADGHLKAQNVVAACQRSRTMREEILRTSPDKVNPLTVGTQLFADYCFHIYGEFLPPMPPPSELSTLIAIGGGKTIHFLDDIALAMDAPANRHRTLVVVSDKLNQTMLRRATKELAVLPQLRSVAQKHVVSYQWILNSISEAKLRAFN